MEISELITVVSMICLSLLNCTSIVLYSNKKINLWTGKNDDKLSAVTDKDLKI